MKKRILSLAIALVMLVSVLSVTAFAAAMPFTDVSANQWYYHDVQNAYEKDLINGKTPTTFAPNDNLTYAEAVKLAACMNQRYQTGSVTLKNGDPWYQSYVDYCKTNGMISVDYSWNANATRAGYMEIFANALPDSALKAINEVPDGSIPDVPMSHPQAAAIYKLYRAGILQGNDAAHNCSPGSNIKRSEVAAILTRMMDASKRITFSMKADALRIVKQSSDVTVKEGDHVTLEVQTAGGKAPYSYEWAYKTTGGAWEKDIDHMFRQGPLGEPKLEIICSSFNAMMGRPFRCTVTDAEGKAVMSSEMTISMEKDNPMTIVTQPYSGSGKQDSWDYLTVEVNGGTQPYEYEWQYMNVDEWNIVGGTEYAENAFSATMDILYDVQSYLMNTPIRCVITDAKGQQITTNEVTCTVEETAATEPLSIIMQPVDPAPLRLTDNEDCDITFYVGVDGGHPPYTYHWKVYEQPTNSLFVSDLFSTYVGYPTEETTDAQMHTIRYLVDYLAFYDMFGTGSPASTFEVLCVITDSEGNEVTTDSVLVKNS